MSGESLIESAYADSISDSLEIIGFEARSLLFLYSSFNYLKSDGL